MKRPIYLLSGAYGSRNTSNGYVSEGLISLPVYLTPNTTVVCSSDILGPSWFTSGKAAKVSLKDEENLRKKLSSVDIRPPLINKNTVLSPRWVLSEYACKILTDFKYIMQGPVLTILNAFELAMRNVIASANELSAPSLSRNRIDVLLMAENQASKQELVVGRVRRCVALMCYTLIETLLWKERMASKGEKEFDNIPVDVNYRELVCMIKQKCDAFLRGNEVTVASDGFHALLSVTTFVAMVASGSFFDKSLLLPRMVGTFYEAILGVETMSRLGRVVSAEYRNLLKVVEDANRKGHFLPKHKLEKMLEEEEGGREPIKNENVMRWVRLEKHRRNNIQSTDMTVMERMAPKGVNFLPTLDVTRDGLDTSALDDLYSALEAEGFLLTTSPPTEAVERVFFGRQVSHANFNVSYNPYFSFYVLWNWMFLATGALFNTPSNPTTRNLLVNVIVKDMHAILRCPRCYEGFVIKNEEVCRLAQQTTMESSRLNTYLRDIMYTFTSREGEGGEEENALFKKIILFDNGGLGLTESEETINRMTESEKKMYAFRAITASKGFAAIGLYSLLYNVKLQDLAENDIEVVQLLNRWVLDGSILYTIDFKGNGSSSATPAALTGRDRATIAFIGLWSLRNAVRLCRDVQEPTNYGVSSFPSSPMTLSSALLQTSRFKNDSFLNLPYITNFKEEFVNTVDKFKEEIICAKRSRTREADAEYYKFGKRLTRARVVEPLGSYKLSDALKDQPSLERDAHDRSSSSCNYNKNPSTAIEEVALPLETVKGEMDIWQEDLMLSSDEEDGRGGGNDDGIPEEVLKELMEKSDPESSDDDSSECSSSTESSSSSSSESEDEDDSVTQKKKKDEDESEESVTERLEELLETMEKLPLSCSSFDDEHEPDITGKASTSSRKRKVFTKTTNNALPSSSSSSNKEQSTLSVYDMSYSSGSSSSEEDVVMKSISDDDDDSDSDFDPDIVLKQMEQNKDAFEDTASVISTASSTATWSNLLACRKNNHNSRKRRKLDADNKFVRLSQTTLSINALKDEFFLSLGSFPSLSLSSRSSELATAIVERASKTSDNMKKKQQQQARYENFSPVTSVPTPAVMRSKRIISAASSNISVNRYGYKPQLTPDVEFVNEIKTVIAIYFSLVFLQRAMNNNNNNSSGYYEDMVHKMIGIINNIPREEMSHEKYRSVVRDALYIYCIVISKLTGPEHLKRLRTPKQQSVFCYMIAMMVNNLPIDSDLSLAGKLTNLVQFASGMSDPAYRTAVRNLSSIFNNSYSVNKALNLPPSYLVMVNQILSILSSKNTSLCERKARTLAQSVYLYYDHRLRDSLRSSGLTNEDSSLGATVRLVSQQLAVDGIDDESLEDGLCMAAGKLDVDGMMLKSLGGGQKDIKIVGLSTLLTQRFRKEARTIAIT